jgi:hypothetical protein
MARAVCSSAPLSGAAPFLFMSEKGGLGEQSGKRGQGDCDWRLAVLMRRDRGLKTFIP